VSERGKEVRDRGEIAKELRRREHGIGLHERELQVLGAVLEVLLDVRDLLQSLQPKNIIVATAENPDCNCAATKTDGESEHWPQCRYA